MLASVERQQRYAAEIVAALRDADFPVREGTLYPLLSKPGRDGLLAHQWRESASGPPRRYFSLTDTGVRRLAEFRNYWNQLSATMNTMGR